MAKTSTLRASIDMAKKIQDTAYKFDDEKSREVLETMRRELQEEEKKAGKLTYRDANYRFNL